MVAVQSQVSRHGSLTFWASGPEAVEVHPDYPEWPVQQSTP